MRRRDATREESPNRRGSTSNGARGCIASRAKSVEEAATGAALEISMEVRIETHDDIEVVPVRNVGPYN